MKRTIVKFAQDGIWDHYFEEDPKDGVCIEHSAHTSYAGQVCNIKPYYTDFDEAVKVCAAVNQVNPSGSYAVCILKEKKP